MNTDRNDPAVLIFAGTTEGRILAEYASAHSIRCFVSVATDYGKSLLEKLDNITVLTGRMDEKAMEHFIEEKDIRLVIDATHPFAREVTENIKEACEKARTHPEAVRYVRCVRPFEDRSSSGRPAETTGTSEPEDRAAGREDPQDEPIIYTESVQEAVEYLKKTTGNILIATGSKELHSVHGNRELQGALLCTGPVHGAGCKGERAAWLIDIRIVRYAGSVFHGNEPGAAASDGGGVLRHERDRESRRVRGEG